MTSRFTELTIDAHEPRSIADFWCAVLGYRVIESTDEYVEIASSEPEADSVRAGVVPPPKPPPGRCCAFACSPNHKQPLKMPRKQFRKLRRFLIIAFSVSFLRLADFG